MSAAPECTDCGCYIYGRDAVCGKCAEVIRKKLFSTETALQAARDVVKEYEPPIHMVRLHRKIKILADMLEQVDKE